MGIGGGEVGFGEHLLHPLDDGKEVRNFGGCEFGEALHGAEGDYEDVSWEDGFNVYEGVREGGAIEDLGEVKRLYLIGREIGVYIRCTWSETSKGPNLISFLGLVLIVLMARGWYERRQGGVLENARRIISRQWMDLI